MVNKLKSVLSFITIALFLLFALASFGPDASTNTTVAISNCKEKPQVTGYLHISVSSRTKSGLPIPAAGTIYITHQKVNPDATCTFSSSTQEVDFAVLGNGNFMWEDNLEYFHDNSEDLYRVEVEIFGTQEYQGFRQVQVKKYEVGDFYFNYVGVKLEDL